MLRDDNRIPLAFALLLVAALLAPQSGSSRAVAASTHTVNASAAQPQQLSAERQLARDVFQELIEINTTDSNGNVTAAALAAAARLRAAGFPEADVQVIGADERKRNLVARFRGAGRGKPILLLAHLDVVEARREDWSVEPFKLLEREGYFYGRGTLDNKEGAANLLTSLIRLKREGFTPARDIILALTADEEGGNFNGVEWLLKNRRDLLDVEYCVNTDAGGGQLKAGKHARLTVEASEKIYLSFRLETKHRGGHSSLPEKENAIYRLSDGLSRLARFDFPVRLNEITRAYFQRVANGETGQLASDLKAIARPSPDSAAVSRLSASPYYNAQMRTTCVATRLEGGHADNALPQAARAVVNCRLLPDESPAEVQQTLVRVLADEQISVATINEPKPAPLSPLKPEIMQPVERIAGEMWPSTPVVPVMETGATDGLFLRLAGIPTYGVSGLFIDIDDVRAHGRDERIGVKEFYEAQDFMYRLIKTLSSGS